MSKYSRVCKVDGKSFRYDFDHCVVEYVTKFNKEWEELGNENEGGYVVLDSIGLSRENWVDKESRMAYLDDYSYQIEEEVACMMAMERF